MKHWKTGLFLGLALLSLALPARAAALPEDLESALPRDAGKLLDGVEQWDGESLPEGLSSIWNHLRDDAAEILRRQTRGAVSVLLVVLLCGAAEGFRKSAGASERFLPMAGTLAVTALTAGSLDTLMGVGAAAMERIHTFSQTLLPALAAVSALSGGVAGAAVRQIAAVFFANLLLELIRGLLMPMVYLYAGTLAAGGSLSDKRLLAVAELIRTVCVRLLTAVLLLFTLYLTVSGIFTGSVDSARVRDGQNRHLRRGAGGGGHHRRGLGNRTGRSGAAEGHRRRIRAAGGAGAVRLSLCAAGNPVSSLQADGLSCLCHGRPGTVHRHQRPWRCLRTDSGYGGQQRAGAADFHSGLCGGGDSMIETVRTWLTAVAAVTLLLSVVQQLVPPGSLRETASFAGGLILLTVLLQPLAALRGADLDLSFQDCRQAVEQQQTELEDRRQTELAALIESATAAYISDKADSMGLALEARVTAEAADGVPVPARVTLTGKKSGELSRWLETELGIPAERQVWNEG